MPDRQYCLRFGVSAGMGFVEQISLSGSMTRGASGSNSDCALVIDDQLLRHGGEPFEGAPVTAKPGGAAHLLF